MSIFHNPVVALLLLCFSVYFFAAWIFAPLSLWMVPRDVRDRSDGATLHRSYRWFLAFVGVLLVAVAGVLLTWDWKR